MGDTTGGALRRGSDRIVGGVCSGLAAYFGVDALLVRIVFVILALVPPGIGIGVLLYLALWFLMEPPAPAPGTRNIGDRVRAMGDELREDFRTGFRTHASGGASGPGPTGGSAIPAPGAGAPDPAHGDRWGSTLRGRSPGLWAGIILIAIGAYFLMDSLGLLRLVRWDVVGPVVLIAVGLLVLARRR